MTATLSTDQKTAYTKGWESQAKTVEGGMVAAEKRYGAGALLLDYFRMGITDRKNGATKWDSIKAMELQAEREAHHEAVESALTQVEVDGVVIAETTHTELPEITQADEDADLAAEARYIEGEVAEDEAEAENHSTDPADFEDDNGWISVRTLQEILKGDISREEKTEIRKLIATKKNHYKMGWNSQQSPLFNGHAQAEAGYLKRRPGSPYLEDWNRGYADREDGKTFGNEWTAKAPNPVSPETLAALHREIAAQGE